MKTIGGQLHITKTEVKLIRILLEHALKDISYREGGTYYKKNNPEEFDEGKANKAKEAILDIEWIITNANYKQ